jgi:hypothetical protein
VALHYVLSVCRGEGFSQEPMNERLVRIEDDDRIPSHSVLEDHVGGESRLARSDITGDTDMPGTQAVRDNGRPVRCGGRPPDVDNLPRQAIVRRIREQVQYVHVDTRWRLSERLLGARPATARDL